MTNDTAQRRTGARTSLVLALMTVAGGGGWHVHQMDAEALHSAQHDAERYADLQQHCFDRQLDQINPKRVQP